MTGRKLMLAAWFVVACRDPTHKAAAAANSNTGDWRRSYHVIEPLITGVMGPMSSNTTMSRGGWAQHHVLANDFAASVQEGRSLSTCSSSNSILYQAADNWPVTVLPLQTC